MFSLIFRSFLVTSLVGISGIATASQLKNLQTNHQIRTLSDTEIRYLANLRNSLYTNQVLDNILIPRVVGTPEHERVFKYIVRELEKLNWKIDVDEFMAQTPNMGTLPFKNIVASLNSNADRYLVIACHYDSKYFENDVFVGATDSAVPCAMMLNLAQVLKNEFNSIRDRTDLSIKLLFLDGEEAFEEWGPKDSIYGARHLAAKYHQTREVTSQGENVSHLQKMDLFMLLDLIGHSDTTFYNQFSSTTHWYLRMAEAESRLKNLQIIRNKKNIFVKQQSYGRIEDDHVPFMRRNVPILHLISTPFPREWHTPNDNRNIVDIKLVENINTILRIFVVEYLHIYLPDTSKDTPEKEL